MLVVSRDEPESQSRAVASLVVVVAVVLVHHQAPGSNVASSVEDRRQMKSALRTAL